MTLPPRLNGTGLSDAWLNKLLDCVKAARPINSPLIRASESANGTALYPLAVGGGAAPAGDMIGTLTAVFDNYLVLTDLVSGQVVRVAKQYKIRNSIVLEETLDANVWGMTYQTGSPNTLNSLAYVARTKTLEGNNQIFEYQRVTPVYSVADPGQAVKADQITYTPISSAYAAALNIKTIGADSGVTTGTLVTNLEVGPARFWRKKIDQTQP